MYSEKSLNILNGAKDKQMKFKKIFFLIKESLKFRRGTFVFAAAMLLSLCFVAACSFMEDDEFFGKIENEVAVANADKMNVYIRYANTRFGKTSPADAGYFTAKNNVAFSVSATTNTDYGFFKWAAFSTKDFDPAKQYQNLIYNNDEEYNELFAPLELPETVVKFSNKNSQSTDVTIYTTRNDIWIIPVIVSRPVLSNTFPKTTVKPVRNSPLRIQFSKPMDEASFENNFTIGEGNIDGGFKLSLVDITDKFDYKFNDAKDLITFTFKEDSDRAVSGFNAQNYVRISFNEDISDIYGYKMSASDSREWEIGTTYDRDAPIIVEFSGGIGSDFTAFASSGTVADSPALKSLDNTLYTSSLLLHRTSGKVNLYVFSQDTAGAGTSLMETDVLQIGFKAKALIDMSGNPLDDSTEDNSLASSYLSYSALLNNSEVAENFSSLMPDKSGGCLYTYDISSLPDGIIKIDVWGIDMTGNNGLDHSKSELDNGYKSIFVVKDSHSPAIETEKDKVRSSSESAPYGWYNGSSINPIKMNEMTPIVDLGNEKLRSPHDKIKWMFRLGAETDWTVGVNDSSWKLLTTPATPYEVGNARVDSEGAVSITMRLMDDLGNMTSPVAISSAFYDATSPSISALAWVNADGSVALNASKEETLAQILKIPFVEEKSGIKRIEVKVLDSGGNVVSGALDSAVISYSADGAPSVASAVTYDTSDSAHTGSVLVFTDSVTTGNLYISGIKIRNDTDETFTVKVRLCDAAINDAEKSTTINCDITRPEIKEVSVVDISPRATCNGTTDGVTKWLPYSAYDTVTQQAVKARVSVNVEESGSGIYEIKLSEDAYLTSSSYITIDGTALAAGTDFSLDVAGNTILMKDMFDPKLIGDDITFIIENVKIDNDNSTVTVSVKDFALNDDSKSLPNVMKDSNSPEIGDIILSDRGVASGTLPSVTDDDDGTRYTNDRIVDLRINAAKDGALGSGLRGIVLDSGATFTDSTEISVEISESASPCTFTKTDDKTVTFETAYAYDSSVNFVIKNISLDSETDGVKTVTAHLVDMCGWKSTVKSDSIVLDRTPPTWLDKWIYVADNADSGNVAGEIYPAAGAIGVYAAADEKPYFYTKNANVYLSVSYSDANFYGSKYSTTKTEALQILSDAGSVELEGSASLEFPALLASGSTMYSIVLRDKAGNVSVVKSFHAVHDIAITNKTGASDISLTNNMAKLDSRSDYRVYLEGPSNTNRFSTTGATGLEDYKVYISVNLSDYTEKTYTTSQAGLARFAINDSASVPPSVSGTGTDFNKWIPYSAAAGDEIKVWIPSDDNERGPYYLWLMDNVSNTTCVQIRTPANESATPAINETWRGKASVSQIGTIDYVNGTATESTTEEPGKLVTSTFDGLKGNVTYYNDEAKIGFTYTEGAGINFSGAGTATNYPVRVALVKKTAKTPPSKADVSDSDWLYPDSASDTTYTFANKSYPKDLSETEKYGANYEYLYYIIEDAVGHVNTGFLKPGADDSRWKYDNDAPKVTIRESPNVNLETAGAENLIDLVPMHYGRLAFCDSTGSKVWVPATAGEIAETVEEGDNTYHRVEKALYFDLNIAEATKIRKFYYSTSDTSEALDSASWQDSAGGKVDVCIPVSILSSETNLYLHVRDIVGNVKAYKLSSLKWQSDADAPDFASGTITPPYKLKEGYYYALPDIANNTIVVALSGNAYANDSVKVTIPLTWFTDNAGSGVYAYSFEDSEDNPGSIPISIDIDSGDSENTNQSPCIELSKGTHYKTGEDMSFCLYVYDSVGNCKKVNLTTRVDTYAPVFKLGFDIDGTGSFKHPLLGNVTIGLSDKVGYIYDAIRNIAAYKNYKVEDSPGDDKEFQSKVENQDSPGYTESNPYIIYASPDSVYTAGNTYTNGKRYFIGTFSATDEDTGAGGATLGISDIKVDRKLGVAGSTWENDYLTMSNLDNVASDTSRSYVTKVPIDLDDTGRFYRITVSDYAGNTTEVYIKLFLDVTAPRFTDTGKPTVTATTGSINTDGTNYYFNEMKLDFTGKDMISDSNTGLASGTKNYEILSGTDSIKAVTAVTDSDDGFTVSLTNAQAGFDSHTDGNKLFVRLMDNLNNSKEYDLYYGSTKVDKPWVRDSVAPVWSTGAIGELSGSYAKYFNIEGNLLLYTSYYKYKEITLKPTSASDTGSGIMGYVISTDSALTGPYTSAKFTNETASLSAASPAFIKKGGRFTFKVSDFIGDSTEGTIYIYAVDYAGNMTCQPLQILEDAGYPVVSLIVASTSGDIYCDSTQNYYNTDAKIKVTANVVVNRGTASIKYYMFKNSDISEDSDEASFKTWPSTGILELPSTWTAGDTLYLHLVSSRWGVTKTPVKLQGDGSLNSTVAQWTKDTTPPVISLSYKSGGVVESSDKSRTLSADDIVADGKTYITNVDGFVSTVNLTDNASGVASSKVGSTDKTDTTYEITSNSPGETTITAKDNVGNSSTFTFTTQRDVDAPSVSNLVISNASEADAEWAVHSVNADSSGVIYFNPSHINVSVTTSDTQTTVAGYLVDSSNTADATSAGWTTTLSSDNLASADGTVLYLHVKDILNNVAHYPFAGNASYTPMGASSAVTAAASSTWKALTGNSASVASVAPSVENGSGIYYDSAAKKIWYNPNFNGTPLSLSLTPAASGSLVKGYRIGAAGNSCTAVLPLSLADGDIAIYSVDYAGNISTSAFTLTLIDDSTAPSIAATLASGKITSDKTALIADGAALASGTEYYTNSAGYTSNIALTEEGAGVDSVTGIDETAGSYSVTISDAGEKTVTAKDKVGNEGTFTFKTSLVSSVPAVTAVIYTSSTTMNKKAGSPDSLYFSSAYISAATLSETSVLTVKYELSTDATGVAPTKALGSALSLDDFSGKSSDEVYIWSGDVLGNTEAVALSSVTATYTPLSGTATTITGTYKLVQDSDKPAAPNSVSDNQGDNTDFDSSKKILYYNTSVAALEITPTLATADDSLMGFMSASDSTAYFDKLILSGDSLVPGDKSFYSIDYAGNVSESSYDLTLKKAVSYKIEGKKITLSDFPAGETIASITLTASAGSFPSDLAAYSTGNASGGGTAEFKLTLHTPSSSLTSVELTSANDIPSDLTISKIKLSSSAGSIVDIIPSNPSNYISVPGVFAGSFPLIKSTERSLPRGRSITHEELLIQNEALLSRVKKNSAKSASPKADLSPASAVSSSTENPAWSGLSRDFNSESENLDRAVSRLKSSAAKASSSEKASTLKTVSKVKEEAGIPEVEAKVSVTESVAPSVEKVAPVSVTQQDSAEKPFRKIGLLILLAVFVLSGAFFAKKVEIFHKKS